MGPDRLRLAGIDGRPGTEPLGRDPRDWERPPTRTRPGPGEVDVWRFGLDLDPGEVEALAVGLADDERDRAGRFVFPRDRDRYVAGRGRLRAILGGYLGLGPGEVRFAYGPRGKPALVRSGDRLRFNLAHAQGLALLAIAEGREVGIDLEQVRPLPDADALAGRFFSVRERDELRARPDADRLAAFFTCWTRKEAYLKALGDGLAAPLDRFRVTIDPDGPARLLEVDGRPGSESGWTMVGIAPAPGYVGALVVRREEDGDDQPPADRAARLAR